MFNALIAWWNGLSFGYRIVVFSLVMVVPVWLASGSFLTAIGFSLIAGLIIYGLVGPSRDWLNLLFPLLLVTAVPITRLLEPGTLFFSPQNWAAIGLMVLLIVVYTGVWIWRSVQGRLRDHRQHYLVGLGLLGLLVGLFAIFIGLFPRLPGPV